MADDKRIISEPSPVDPGTINYEKTKKELMINNPKMKNLFDKRQKEYEKLY